MKRIIAFLAASVLFGIFSLNAAPVSESTALDIARKLFAAQPATKSQSDAVRLVWNGEDAATKAIHPAFYVFSRDGGGFVIIAGDDNVQPVLALSDRNGFKVEGMPENVRWWMERMKEYVRSSSRQTQAVRDQWAALVGTKGDSQAVQGTVTDKVEKLTPEWDQGNNDSYYFGQNIFNAKCPMDGETYSVTGCVALSIAEILTCQSGLSGVDMPVSASGTVGGYMPASGFVAPPAYELGTVYDWENLRTLTDIAAVRQALQDEKTELLDNLAQLTADLGAMVQANYSANGTSAVTSAIPRYLGTYLGMNKGAYYANASDYTPHQWIEKLKAELDKRPLIYNGRNSSNAGHAFVFDGYGKYGDDDVFHVNFGWGGMCNGYYYQDNTDAGGTDDYKYECGAIFDFYPDPSSEYPVSINYIRLTGTLGEEPVVFCGITAPKGLKYGESGTVVIGGIHNSGNADYVGSFKLVREKRDGSCTDIMEIASFTAENPLSPGYYRCYAKTLSIGGDAFSFGEHLAVYYSNPDKSSWTKVSGRDEAAFVSDLALLPAPFIKVESSYRVNDWFALRLMNCAAPYAGTVWTITDPDGNKVVKNQADGEFQFTEAGTYRVEAAVAPAVGEAVVETIVAFVKVL